jgi:hypothetical protein
MGSTFSRDKIPSELPHINGKDIHIGQEDFYNLVRKHGTLDVSEEGIFRSGDFSYSFKNNRWFTPGKYYINDDGELVKPPPLP